MGSRRLTVDEETIDRVERLFEQEHGFEPTMPFKDVLPVVLDDLEQQGDGQQFTEADLSGQQPVRLD